MEEEKIVVQPIDEIDHTVQVEEIKEDITGGSSIEYIEVEEPDEIFIEVSESPVAFNGENITRHNDLQDRNIADQHEICAITGLQNALNKLSLVSEKKDGITNYYEQYAARGGFAEFRRWLNDNRGVGYFVSLVNGTDNNTYVDICTTDTDVYGVTVSQNEVGFYGYQDETYNALGSSGGDHSTDPSYAKVCLLGNVKVRIAYEDYNNVAVGDYVVPNSLGLASCKSDDGTKHKVGFKVISKGTMELVGDSSTAWCFVSIALVPQNDNVNRVMEELQNAQVKLENVVIQVGDMSDTVGGMSNKVEGFEDFLEESTIKVNQQIAATQEMAERADKVSAEAKNTVNAVQASYVEVMSNSVNALAQATSAVTAVTGLRDSLEPLATWAERYECTLQRNVAANEKCYFVINNKAYSFIMPLDMSVGDIIQYDPKTSYIVIGEHQAFVSPIGDTTDSTLIEEFVPTGKYGLTGYVAWANENSVGMANLTERVSENSADIISITQTIDDNGASVQQLITRADMYSLGPHSLSYRFTYDEAIGILKVGHIYVPTVDHSDETSYVQNGAQAVEFKRGKSYIWAIGNTPDVYTWVEQDAPVSTSTEYISGTNEGDLWYCWEGMQDGNKFLYNPETLYRWDGAQWISVATVNGNSQARAIGLVRQTADELMSMYTDLDGNVSSIHQTVGEIDTTVQKVSGELSNINQTAENILMGVYDSKSSTTLEVLLNGMNSTSTEMKIVEIKHSLTAPNVNVEKYYKAAPSWNGEKFVFAGEPSDNGTFYFNKDNDGNDITKYYCEALENKTEYKMYGIGNMALASIHSRVSDTESAIESWTQFKADVNETMTSISQSSSETEAEIFSMVFGEYRQRINANLSPTDEDLANIPTDGGRYSKPPEWKENADGVKTFIFDENNADENGIYCLPVNGDGTCYYKLLLSNGNIVGYEEYKMKASNYATIMQKTDENGSSIGLVAGDDSTIGSLFVNAINDKSEVRIDADKIGINGTAVFTDNLNDGTTTISGNYIRTGILQSKDYLAPLEDDIFAQVGTAFNLDYGTINSMNFNLDASGNVNIRGTITATAGNIGGCSIVDGLLIVDSANIPSLEVSQISSGTNNKDIIFTGNIVVPNITAKGEINATSGAIGAWTIDENFIFGKDANGNVFTKLTANGEIYATHIQFAPDVATKTVDDATVSLGYFTGYDGKNTTTVFGMQSIDTVAMVLETTSADIRLSGQQIYLQSWSSTEGKCGVKVSLDQGSTWTDLADVVTSGSSVAVFG